MKKLIWIVILFILFLSVKKGTAEMDRQNKMIFYEIEKQSYILEFEFGEEDVRVNVYSYEAGCLIHTERVTSELYEVLDIRDFDRYVVTVAEEYGEK